MELVLNKHKESLFHRKHPWLFSGAIHSDTSSLEEGTLVEIVSHSGSFMARGHFQRGSIAVRILSFEEHEIIDQAFWNSRIQDAVSLREKCGLFSAENSICRLVHGEGDFLPGLIVDWFNGVAVMQCHSIGMYRQRDNIVAALQFALGERLQAVYCKSKDTLPTHFANENAYLFGAVQVPHIAHEYGHSYYVNWETGQKTGFFIDQRENRALLAKYAKGKDVLNTFCYSGGFSITALAAGATAVHSLDSSKKAIELAQNNVILNQLEKNHTTITDDAMHFFQHTENEYDIIVVDPPAFAKNISTRHNAVQGYKRLNAFAMKRSKKGGIIFTFSCSQVVDKTLFTNTIIAAAIESGRKIRILEQLHQPADHPINAFHPEGEYLKGLVVEVI